MLQRVIPDAVQEDQNLKTSAEVKRSAQERRVLEYKEEQEETIWSMKNEKIETASEWKLQMSWQRNSENSFRILTCVIFSLLAFGFRGASVSRTGCSSGATLSSL